MKQKKQKKQECPLCEVSQETLEKLKENKKKPLKKLKKKNLLKIGFLIVVLILAGFASYEFFSNFSSEKQLGQGAGVEEKGEIFETPEIGALAPDFVLKDTSGNKVTLSYFRGKKPVLLVFWATWCGYCAKELPDLKIFSDKYQNEIQVIAVSSGESKETIQSYIQEKNVNFLMLLDENREVWSQYLVRGTPSHFLIDKNGEIVTLRPGFALINDLETMLSMLK